MLNLKSIFVLPCFTSLTYALWPLPQDIHTGNSPLRLDSTFSISVTSIPNAPKDILDATQRTQHHVQADKLAALVPDRGASSKSAVAHAKALQSLSLRYTGGAPLKSISQEAVADIDRRVEAYTLIIPADGSEATLSANSSLGLLRGLTTFEQLWYELDGKTYTLQAPIKIHDYPAYVC